jgi:flagellar biosynthesis/type III secretory pathway chaperone
LETLIQNLKTCLRQQIEAYEALAPILNEEKTALVQIDLPAIHRFAKRKAEIAEQARVLDDERNSIATELARTLGNRGPVPRLAQLIELLPEHERDEIRALREQLIWAIAAVHEGQGRNRSLAQRFQSLLQRSMSAVQEAMAALPLYTTGAKMGHSHIAGSVLSHQA